MHFDNRQLDLTLQGDDDLHLALQLAFSDRDCTHWAVANLSTEPYRYGAPPKDAPLAPTLVLMWSDARSVHAASALPVPLDADGVFNLVVQWLKHAQYGPEPDHDGDNDRGFRLFTDAWAKLPDYSTAICGIQPAWAMYGK